MALFPELVFELAALVADVEASPAFVVAVAADVEASEAFVVAVEADEVAEEAWVVAVFLCVIVVAKAVSAAD